MARIHIAKHELGMDDAEYRTLLKAQTQKDSCGKMSLAELFKVEHYLKTVMGWKPKRAKSLSGKRASPVSKGRPTDKLRALWIDMYKEGFIKDGSENALENWVKKMSVRLNDGHGIEKVDWLDTATCSRLIEQLKRWQYREIKKRRAKACQ
ncbi:hypothetical protein GZ78_04115 [Endozoicomonas numazuensis]|uniref:Rha family transcriptional regulator n=1 Tax=Endozoicomonas numazuensis TaxID=1137799 RepID=A0A081NL64_9GAMM|nr:hypothetical protein GZ78_04115 [Endozoicomonas numazuensis]